MINQKDVRARMNRTIAYLNRTKGLHYEYDIVCGTSRTNGFTLDIHCAAMEELLKKKKIEQKRIENSGRGDLPFASFYRIAGSTCSRIN
jgi:hypothetical protein